MVPFRTFEFTSPSLSHPSASLRVDMLEKDPNKEPRINWYVGDGLLHTTSNPKGMEELEFRVARTTIYSKNGLHGALCLASPEHLSPVFLMWPSLRFDVHLAAITAELPMMDGSAIPFFHALRREAGVPEPLRFYDAPVNLSLEYPQGCAHVSPSDTFEVEYTVTRGGSFCSSASLSVYSAEDLYRALMARTFIFESDYAKARADGLLAGVDESCGLLLPEDGGMPRFRMKDEPAYHKILDLLGDLAFAVPALPKVRVQILNGGHIIHHQIMEKLLPYVSTGNPQEI